MALLVRKATDLIATALLNSFNSLKKELAAQLTTLPHADITSKTSGNHLDLSSSPDIIVSDAASDLATTITLSNEARVVFNRHLVDIDAHKASSSVLSAPAASDLATVETLLNNIKSTYTSHASSTAKHYTADVTNSISSPDATDLASAETLANEIKSVLNAHIQFGFMAPSLHLVDC